MIIACAIIFLIAGTLITLHIRYHSFDPADKNSSINYDDISYFSEDYDTARTRFLDSASRLRSKYPDSRLSSFRIDSSVDQNLYMDLYYIPPDTKKKKLLLLVSGTHGIEGFTGGAVQLMFMEELIESVLEQGTGVALIHSFNPYGQKYLRKTTEFNIDLNRNCVQDRKIFNSHNPGYKKMNRFLEPKGKVRKNSAKNRYFYVAAVWKILRDSFSSLRQSALQGQFDFPRGLYYGGKEYAPQTTILKDALSPIFNDYSLIFSIDIHSAYGKWGKLHLFPNPESDTRIKSMLTSLFKGYPIHWGDTEDFYTITGDLSGFLKGINPDATTLCMPFEFGTMNSHMFFGSLISIQRMILENQGHFFGYKNDRHEEKVKREFLEMYYPGSHSWRSQVIGQSRRMLKLCLGRYFELKE